MSCICCLRALCVSMTAGLVGLSSVRRFSLHCSLEVCPISTSCCVMHAQTFAASESKLRHIVDTFRLL